MENCYALYLLIAIIIVIFVMSQMRNENMSDLPCNKNPINVRRVHQLPSDAKRCSLCHHCPCITKKVDMPERPVLYYGGNGEYLAKKVSPYNPAYICNGREFGNQEPNVPSDQRECWIGSELQLPENSPRSMVGDINCERQLGTLSQNEFQGELQNEFQDEPQAVPQVLDHGSPLEE